MLIALLLALSLVAAACGGADSGSSDDSAASGDGLFRDSGSDGDAEGSFADDAASSDDGSSGDDGGDDGDAEGNFAPPATVPAASGGDSGDSGDDAMAEDDGGYAEAPASSAAPPADGNGLFDDDSRDADAENPDEEDIDVTTRDNGIRGFVETDEDPESTFALDVDTGSFTIGRRYIEQGQLPPPESVRVEEYVNAFDYDYDSPDDEALGIFIDGGPSPFDDDNYLLRIGIQGERVRESDRPDAHLTFVVDTSGSMDRPDRLDLVRESLTLLVEELDDDDTVSIVTYSDSSGVVLQPTRVRDEDEILDAIDDLRPGGSTNLEAGLRTGYALASEVHEDGDINRVILASDGIANVGLTDPEGLADLIRADADRGIQLVTVGYGMDGFNDVTMEQLADNGDGFYAYVDSIDEAERLFDENLTSTLLTIALDAKIQVEFDEDVVREYRLIGFENRGVRDDDFRNDDVDAGEIGAGHQVTAIYEIEFVRGVDTDDRRERLGEVNLRWEDPDSGDVTEIDENISMRDIEEDWTDTDETFRLATVVTSFAELLRDSPYADAIDYDQLVTEASALADDLGGDDLDQLVDLLAEADRLA